MVIFGTKWPSITSTWRTLAPPSTTACASVPRRAKSADRMEGASSIISLQLATRACSASSGPILSIERSRIVLALDNRQPRDAMIKHGSDGHQRRIVEGHINWIHHEKVA